jgi:hypothetical protein
MFAANVFVADGTHAIETTDAPLQVPGRRGTGAGADRPRLVDRSERRHQPGCHHRGDGDRRREQRGDARRRPAHDRRRRPGAVVKPGTPSGAWDARRQRRELNASTPGHHRRSRPTTAPTATCARRSRARWRRPTSRSRSSSSTTPRPTRRPLVARHGRRARPLRPARDQHRRQRQLQRLPAARPRRTSCCCTTTTASTTTSSTYCMDALEGAESDATPGLIRTGTRVIDAAASSSRSGATRRRRRLGRRPHARAGSSGGPRCTSATRCTAPRRCARRGASARSASSTSTWPPCSASRRAPRARRAGRQGELPAPRRQQRQRPVDRGVVRGLAVPARPDVRGGARARRRAPRDRHAYFTGNNYTRAARLCAIRQRARRLLDGLPLLRVPHVAAALRRVSALQRRAASSAAFGLVATSTRRRSAGRVPHAPVRHREGATGGVGNYVLKMATALAPRDRGRGLRPERRARRRRAEGPRRARAPRALARRAPGRSPRSGPRSAGAADVRRPAGERPAAGRGALERRHASALRRRPELELPPHRRLRAARAGRRHLIRISTSRRLFDEAYGRPPARSCRASSRRSTPARCGAPTPPTPRAASWPTTSARPTASTSGAAPPAELGAEPAATCPFDLPERYLVHFGTLGVRKGTDASPERCPGLAVEPEPPDGVGRADRRRTLARRVPRPLGRGRATRWRCSARSTRRSPTACCSARRLRAALDGRQPPEHGDREPDPRRARDRQRRRQHRRVRRGRRQRRAGADRRRGRARRRRWSTPGGARPWWLGAGFRTPPRSRHAPRPSGAAFLEFATARAARRTLKGPRAPSALARGLHGRYVYRHQLRLRDLVARTAATTQRRSTRCATSAVDPATIERYIDMERETS